MAQDVGLFVKVLCHSHLIWLVFEDSIPTCACFHSGNSFGTCSFCFFFVVVVVVDISRILGKIEVGGEAKGKMHGL